MLVAIAIGRVTVCAYLAGFWSPRTCQALLRALPLSVPARVERGLLAVEVGLKVPQEGHRELLCSRELAYWPPADSLVVSTSEICKKFPSSVNYLGFIVKGWEDLASLPPGRYSAVVRLAHG